MLEELIRRESKKVPNRTLYFVPEFFWREDIQFDNRFRGCGDWRDLF
jgi:hypothetical protein